MQAQSQMEAQAAKPTTVDAAFATEAAGGSVMEVKLGELAQTNAASSAVKQFGQAMITDHSKANGELQTIAAQKNIALPTNLEPKEQKAYDKLAMLKGEDFDKAYTKFMIKDHKKDIKKFRKEARKGNDEALKTWASDKVPTLEHHLMMAKDARAALKAS